MSETSWAFAIGVGVGAFIVVLAALVYVGFSLVKIDHGMVGEKRRVTILPTNRL